MKRNWRCGSWIVVVIMSLCLMACSKKEPLKSNEPPFNSYLSSVPVTACCVEEKEFVLHFESMGNLRASQIVEVKPHISGVITHIHFNEGSSVRKGDPLYTIDDTYYMIKMNELEAVLLQNKAQLDHAQKKLNRYKSLQQSDLVAQADFDQLSSQVKYYEGMILADQARVDLAKRDVNLCSIQAPISGKIGKSSLHVGNKVEGKTLATIFQIEPLYVDFILTEKEFSQLPEKNLTIEIYSLGEFGESGEDRLLSLGKVMFIDTGFEPSTGMISLSALLATNHQKLVPGQSVRVHLIYGKKELATVIPSKAIKRNQTGAYVYVVKDDHSIEYRFVKPEKEEKGQTLISYGLKPGEKVVTEGHSRVYPGLVVEESLQ